MSAAEEFNNKIMRDAVTLLCANMGWDSGQSNAIDILADVMKRYLGHLAKSTHRYAEHYGRTDVNLDDAGLALKDLGVNPQELEEYIQNYDPIPLPYVHKVPFYPVPRASKLNFLRPGSEEVLTRPVHVHEYMPPMLFVSFNNQFIYFNCFLIYVLIVYLKEPKIVQEEFKVPQQQQEVEEEEKMEIEEIIPPPQQRHTPPPPPPSNHKERHGESSEDEIEALESKSPGAPFVPFSSLTSTVTKTKR
jgi:histone H3/H4